MSHCRLQVRAYGAEIESASFIVSPTQVALDTAMLDYDVWGTQAHVLMLAATGCIAARGGGGDLRGAGGRSAAARGRRATFAHRPGGARS